MPIFRKGMAVIQMVRIYSEALITTKNFIEFGTSKNIVNVFNQITQESIKILKSYFKNIRLLETHH